MKLLLLEAIRRSGGDDLIFFQTAYLWRFQKQIDVAGDVLAWRVQEQVPQYVREYLRFQFDL